VAIYVRDVLAKLMEPVGRIETEIDTLKSGSPDTEVASMATAFMATHKVVSKAVALGVNLLIVHEGIFFRHKDFVGEPRASDPVYLEKWKLIAESGIAIYRFHDGLHRYRPDGIAAGLIQALGWQQYVSEHQASASIVTLPATTVQDVAAHVKAALNIPYVRVVGDLRMSCARVGLLAGYRGGGATAIPMFNNNHVDLIVAGEGPEWETPEYVRDAVYQGRRKALMMLGHAESEESGMKYLAENMKTMFPGVPVHFIAENSPFRFV
jgi:putative NIF3 family GTP cyclohydrolase 1 type 2